MSFCEGNSDNTGCPVSWTCYSRACGWSANLLLCKLHPHPKLHVPTWSEILPCFTPPMSPSSCGSAKGASGAKVFSAEARQGHAAASLSGFTFTPPVTMNESIAVHPNEGGIASSLSRSRVCPSSQTSTLPEVEEGFACSYLYYYSRTLCRP